MRLNFIRYIKKLAYLKGSEFLFNDYFWLGLPPVKFTKTLTKHPKQNKNNQICTKLQLLLIRVAIYNVSYERKVYVTLIYFVKKKKN